MPEFKVVYRSPSVKRGQELAGDALCVTAIDEKTARKEAKSILDGMFFGQKAVIAWVNEIAAKDVEAP